MERFPDILTALGQNMAMVLALLLVLSWVQNRLGSISRRWYAVLMGGMFAAVACWGMFTPIELTPGVLVDSRVVLVSLAGLFGGWLAGGVAAVPVCLLRWYLGGVGTVGGILVVLFGALCGAACRQYFCRGERGVRHGHLIILGLLTSAISLSAAALLPGALALETFYSFFVPVIVLYPIGTLVLGSLIIIETNRRKAELDRLESDQRFKRATEASNIGVWEWDARSDTVTRSENLCRLFGLGSSNFPTDIQGFLALPISEDRPAIHRLLYGTLETGESCQAEYRCTWPDGSLHWHNIRGLVEDDLDGQPIRMVGIVANITERKQALIELENSEARLVEAQAISRTGSFEGRNDKDTLYWSRELYRMLECDPDTYVPRPETYLDFTHPDDREAYGSAFRNTFRTGKPFSHEFRPLLKSGESRVFLTYANPIIGEGDKVVGIRGTVQDITDRVRAEQELRESESRYRSLVENLPFCLHEIDLNGSLLSMNSAGLGMINAADEADIRGVPYLGAIAEKDRAAVRQYLDKALAGDTVRFEFEPAASPPGRTFSSSLIPVTAASGGLARLIGYSIDMTQDRQQESALRDLATAIEQAAESIIITDAKGIVQYVNPSYTRTMGYTREETIGHPASIVKSGEHDEAYYAELWKTLNAGKIWHGEFVNRRKDGELVSLRATISPVLDKSGQIVKYVGVQRDVTHERALERQLLHAQKMEAVGTLAGGIAHDFNNILHSILGYCHIASQSDGTRDAETAHCIREIETGANRAANLVGQILTFSRKSDATLGTVSMVRLTREALRFMRGSLPSTVEIRQNIAIGEGNVRGNETQIHQMITNLCTNAFQAMEPGGGLLTVSLDRTVAPGKRSVTSGLLKKGTYLCLSVQDEGCGIDVENIENIFDPFFTTKVVGKGTGLGLSSVHGIVTGMAGAIDVTSEPGKGTCFHIYLPECKETEPPEITGDTTEPTRLARGRGHLLLVDDEPAITEAAKAILSRQGFDVEVFNDSVEALRAFEINPAAVDMVVCDFTMPRMNGIELAGRINALRDDLPILLVTGVIDSVDMESAGKHGVREVLKKPFRLDALVKVVMKYTDTNETV